MGNSNLRTAKKCAEKLAHVYDVKEYKFSTLKVPQQQNSIDCGMFVIAFMEHIAQTGSFDNIFEGVSQEYVTKLRSEYKDKFCC